MPKNDPKKKTGGKARWTASEKSQAKSKDKGKPRRDGDARRPEGAEGKRPRDERSPRWEDRRPAREDSSGRGRGDDRGPRRVDDVVGHRKYIADDRRRRDDRGGYQGRDDRGGDRGGFQRRDDRGGYQGRDDRGGDRGGFQRREDRGGYQGRDDRGGDRGGFQRREDRGGYQGRDDRGGDRGGFQRREDRGGYQGRDDRGGYQGRDDRGGFQRRDDRGGFQGRGDRGGYQGGGDRGGFQPRDDRGGDRGGFQRREDRGGYQGGGDRGGYQGRDDRGGDRGGYQRRDDRGDLQRRDQRGGYQGRDDRGGQGRDEGYEEVLREQEAADTWTKYEARKVDGPTEVTSENGFAALGIPERLVERLARDAITEPFPIQVATIPDALAGRDVLGRGRTGSGKTLAFGLPTIARLAASGKARPKRPRSLVLVPTRELAMQVSDALEPLVHVMGLRHKLVAGGLSYEPQISALARGVDVLIATPGRLSDLIERGAMELDDIQVTILDEADHMAEMGFMTEITGVLDALPPGQRLLFSATLDRGIDALVERYLTDPVTHSTDEAQATITTMAHHLFLVEPQHKKVVTAELTARPGRTIVFARTKLGADRVASQLREAGIMAAALHGGLTQSARNRVLGAFRTGDLPVLVATDVAARGIHVDDVSLVLQIDPPADHKDYLHRSGRTARAGEEGAVVTLALPHQKKMMERLLGEAGVDTRGVKAIPGAEPVRAAGGQEPPGQPVDPEAFKAMLEPVRKQRGQSRSPGPRGDRGRRDGGRGGGDRFGGGRREDVSDGWRSDGKGGGRSGSRPTRFGAPRHHH